MTMLTALRVAALAIMLAATLVIGPPAAAQAPPDLRIPGPVQTHGACRADNVTWVMGDGLCLPIRSFAPRRVQRGMVLVVFLHGNVGAPNAPVGDDLSGFAADIAQGSAAQQGVIAVAMTRPGHTGADGRPAEGMFRPQLFADSADGPAVADAVARLKRHYGARRVVMVGFSGGSRLIARMVQNRLGAFDAAVLYACPCEDPANEIAEAVPEGNALYPRRLQLAVITGTLDYGTRGGPAFVRVVGMRGAPATFRPLRNQAHVFDDFAWSTAVKPALLRFIRGLPPAPPGR
jgi:poly(3-hydroxybutyrate) depolymerase